MKRVTIVLMLVAMTTLACKNAKEEARNAAAIKKMLIDLITKHPDPAISDGLLSKWRHGEIAVAPDLEESGTQGTLLFLTPQEARDYFGVSVPSGTEYPALRLSRPVVHAAFGDQEVRASLMKTIRHEYGHYLQWKDGTAFHDNYPDGSRESCAAIWERELPIYLEDCGRWEKWWSQYRMPPSMKERCRNIDNPRSFKAILAKQLSQKAPVCKSVFEEKID